MLNELGFKGSQTATSLESFEKLFAACLTARRHGEEAQAQVGGMGEGEKWDALSKGK